MTSSSPDLPRQVAAANQEVTMTSLEATTDNLEADSSNSRVVTTRPDAAERGIERDHIIPDEVLYYILLINFWGPALAMSIFGIFTNILNIVTFLKQGIKDAVNISLLGLAISDFWSVITIFMANICFIPEFQALGLPFVAMDFMYIWAWLHIMMTRITAWITVYVTLERCLCIAYPLKVKVYITPRRTVIYIVCLYFIMLASVTPVYYSTRATNVFDPVQNRTIMGIALLQNRNQIETISFTINNAIPMIAFFIVIACTAILVRGLREKAEWRRQSTSVGGKSDAMSDRDRRVVKLVVFVSTIFILCYSPGAVVFIWVIIDPEMRLDGKHDDLLYANFSTLFHLETINASVNLFIYLRMSSKFKSTFLQIFCPCRKDQGGTKKEISN